MLDPTNPYSAAKAGAEMMCKAYMTSYKMPIIITRGNNVYGPHQFPEKLIPKFIIRASRGSDLPIHGDGDSVRSYLYVEDVARAFDAVLHKGVTGEVYNIGTDKERTVMDVRPPRLGGREGGLARGAGAAPHGLRRSRGPSRGRGAVRAILCRSGTREAESVPSPLHPPLRPSPPPGGPRHRRRLWPAQVQGGAREGPRLQRPPLLHRQRQARRAGLGGEGRVGGGPQEVSPARPWGGAEGAGLFWGKGLAGQCDAARRRAWRGPRPGEGREQEHSAPLGSALIAPAPPLPPAPPPPLPPKGPSTGTSTPTTRSTGRATWRRRCGPTPCSSATPSPAPPLRKRRVASRPRTRRAWAAGGCAWVGLRPPSPAAPLRTRPNHQPFLGSQLSRDSLGNLCHCLFSTAYLHTHELVAAIALRPRDLNSRRG